ncbi:hypothetical protein DYE49_11135 [Treponema rectale]|uniref:F5/8 type C domain-containing protein n=1 Tax=Treponema rectale TaxID=744512 RepID=A0A840SI95_9SPIR|nr:family 43 glycosylhydrolase [Treponema rectale]MBB5219131.1 hypothetical protein [Treponema rectale]QOS40969.1 hypothetical protein DYE49_11135 [Treponema rectale]
MRSFILKKAAAVFSCLSFTAALFSCSSEAGTGTVNQKKEMVIAASTFMLEGGSSADNVKLHWNAVEDAAGYTLTRSDGVELISKTRALTNVLFYDDYGIGDNTYTYTVKAFNSNKVQIASANVTASKGTVTDAVNTFNNSPTVETGVTGLIRKSTLVFDGVYYSYSIGRNGGENVNFIEYTSADGENWDEGRVVVTGDKETYPDAFYDEDLASCKLESTCITSHNGQIVIWSHYEEYGSTYTKACVYCAAGTPGGDFKGYGAYQPQGNASRDLTFFEDDDGRGYLISATLGTMYMYRLSSDWTVVDDSFECVTIQENEWREAPCMIHHDGWYYLFSSRQNGWLPTAGQYISSKTLQGLSGQTGQAIGSKNTFGSQSGGVVKIGNQYAMMANRWSGGWEVPDPVLKELGLWSVQRMLPITLKDGYAFYDFYSTVKYDCEQGVMIPVQRGKIVSYLGDTGLSSTAASGCDGKYAVDGNWIEDKKFYRGSDYDFDFVVNLGSKYNISGVDISFYTLQGSEAYCTYNIYGKENASDASWTLIKDCSSNVMMNFNTWVFEPTETAYKYIKIDILGEKRACTNGSNAPHSTVNGSWCTGLYEVQVYGQ